MIFCLKSGALGLIPNSVSLGMKFLSLGQTFILQISVSISGGSISSLSLWLIHCQFQLPQGSKWSSEAERLLTLFKGQHSQKPIGSKPFDSLGFSSSCLGAVGNPIPTFRFQLYMKLMKSISPNDLFSPLKGCFLPHILNAELLSVQSCKLLATWWVAPVAELSSSLICGLFVSSTSAGLAYDNQAQMKQLLLVL